MPSLRVSAPGRPPSVYHLYKKITSIGAGPDNDVVLPDPLIGDTYASIHFDGQTYTITTLARKAEVVVNGKKRGKHKLSHDDKLVIGSCELRFALLDDAPPAEDEAAQTVADLDAYAKLYDFSERLMQKRELGELLDTLMDLVIEITTADKGFLILMEGDTLDVKVARNLRRENIADAVSQLSDSIVAKVVAARRPLIISDAMHDREFAAAKSVMQLRLSSVICVPLLDRGRLIGLIYVGNDSIVNLFQETTMRVLTVFAAQASLIIANAILLNELRLDNRTLAERLEAVRFGEIVGTSPPMQAVYRKVEKIAPTDISVLITGETGTGKELIAREIHTRSPRAGKPFVTINCGAIPENLLESELFGHVKGAFTGAIANKQGQVPGRRRGTLFLDEVGEMPLELQVKLLRGDPGARRGPGRRHPIGVGRHPDLDRDQPRPREGDRRRPVPRGPLLPVERRQPAAPAAPGPRRRRDRDRALSLVALHPRVRRQGEGLLAQRHGRAAQARLARQHPRAREPDQEGDRARRVDGDRPRRPRADRRQPAGDPDAWPRPRISFSATTSTRSSRSTTATAPRPRATWASIRARSSATSRRRPARPRAPTTRAAPSERRAGHDTGAAVGADGEPLHGS
jgi:hypothetical protein